MFTLVLAESFNHVVGIEKDGKHMLPWDKQKTSGDLKAFRELTTNNVIIMGRHTYDSIGRPLPNRVNIVMSRDPNFKPNGVEVFDNVESLIKYCNTWFVHKNLYVIGGPSLIKNLYPHITKAIITCIMTTVPESSGNIVFDTDNMLSALDGWNLDKFDDVVSEQGQYERFVKYYSKG